MSDSRHPSMRLCRRTMQKRPERDGDEHAAEEVAPGPMMRPSASGIAMPVASAASRPICCGPRRSTGLPSADATRSPCFHPVLRPQMRSPKCPTLYSDEKERRRPRRRSRPSPNTASDASEQNGSQPAQTRRSPTLPSGPHSAVRKRSMRSGILAIELGARQRADGDRRQIRMRVEVPALARQRCVKRRRVNAAGQQPQRRLDAEPDAVAEQGLVVPRSLNGEQADEDRDPRARTAARAPATRQRAAARHRTNRRKSPIAKPADEEPARACRRVKQLPRRAAGDTRRRRDDGRARQPRIDRPDARCTSRRAARAAA